MQNELTPQQIEYIKRTSRVVRKVRIHVMSATNSLKALDKAIATLMVLNKNIEKETI